MEWSVERGGSGGSTEYELEHQTYVLCQSVSSQHWAGV